MNKPKHFLYIRKVQRKPRSTIITFRRWVPEQILAEKKAEMIERYPRLVIFSSGRTVTLVVPDAVIYSKPSTK